MIMNIIDRREDPMRSIAIDVEFVVYNGSSKRTVCEMFDVSLAKAIEVMHEFDFGGTMFVYSSGTLTPTAEQQKLGAAA